MNILIIKLGAMGDVVRSTSILPGLQKKYPKGAFYWVTKKESKDLMLGNPYLKEVLFIEDGIGGKLKGMPFGLVVNLDEDEESLKLASEVHCDNVFGGYLDNGNPAYRKDSSRWLDMGLISKFGKTKADELKKENEETYQNILCSMLEIEKSKPVLMLSEDEVEFGAAFFSEKGVSEDAFVVGLNTAAGGRWKGKQISVEKTVELGKALHEKLGATLLLFGGPAEAERNSSIKEGLGDLVVDAGTENSLREFASLINQCDVLITSDSLALHLGVALSKKVIAFFGPTSNAEIDLDDNGVKLVAPECGCFYNDACTLKPNCVEHIPVEDFVKAVEGLR